MSFPLSSIPANLFLYFADDTMQVTSPKEHSASRTFSWRAVPPLQPGSERYTAMTLWFSMAVVSRKVSPRLALLASVNPKKNNESKQADQIFKSSSTKFAPLAAKARSSVRRKGDWKDIANLKVKYSGLDLPLPTCAAALSFVVTLFAGVELHGSDGRNVSTQLSICAEAFFFAQRMFV